MVTIGPGTTVTNRPRGNLHGVVLGVGTPDEAGCIRHGHDVYDLGLRYAGEVVALVDWGRPGQTWWLASQLVVTGVNRAARAAIAKAEERKEWSGSPAPESPDEWWVDDDTGEYVNARTCKRMSPDAGRAAIAAEQAERDRKALRLREAHRRAQIERRA